MDPLETLVAEYPVATTIAVIGVILCLIALRDILQRRHAITHNFPIVGHLRYFFETIGPELRQYFFANDLEEKPFNRAERRWVYATSKKENNTFGFGTSELIYELGYPILKHTTFPISPELNPEAHCDCLSQNRREANKRRHAFNLPQLSTSQRCPMARSGLAQSKRSIGVLKKPNAYTIRAKTPSVPTTRGGETLSGNLVRATTVPALPTGILT